MENVFNSIPDFTVVSVEQEYVLGYFPTIEMADVGLQHYTRMTSSCFTKSYAPKDKDFGNRGKTFIHLLVKSCLSKSMIFL